MILTLEQMRKNMKYLKPVGDEKYQFVRTQETTEEDIKNAKEFDESYVDIYGFHVITNYKEL